MRAKQMKVKKKNLSISFTFFRILSRLGEINTALQGTAQQAI